MKLTGKILLLFLIVVVLITSVASVLSVRSAYIDLEERQQTLARELASQMRDRLASAWANGGPQGISQTLREWTLESEKPVTVHWVMFDDGADRELRPRAPRNAWSVIRRGEIFSVVSTDDQGNRQLHTYLPMAGIAGEIGALELSQPLIELDQHARQVVFTTLSSLAASGLLALLFAYVVGLRWVARPLEALIAHTERIGRGDFTKKLELRGDDELDQLAQALNDMSTRLAEQQETIVRETQNRLNTLQQLRHVDRLGTLGRMAAGIAHELGTPLNVVAGRAALIASGKLDAAEVINSAKTIKSEADRITSIVQRLLDFARGRKPQRTLCELSHVVDRTVNFLAPLAGKRSIHLQFEKPAIETRISVDESQIQQVLTNLIVNAIHATKENGSITLSIDAPESGWLRVRVADTGTGVPIELRERIFEPFFTTKDVGEGTGLGLSIAYGIVQEHGGRLEISDNQPQGAVFDLWLPLEADASADNELHEPVAVLGSLRSES